jgi:hypothetical protein
VRAGGGRHRRGRYPGARRAHGAVLIADRELCRRLGAAGRLKAEREFGLECLVSETLAVYRAAGWKDG